MVHEIHDLSDLIALLGAKPGSPLQLVIHPDVHKSLAAWIEQGCQPQPDGTGSSITGEAANPRRLADAESLAQGL